ncbi:hypothetical protein DRN97_10085 [Methanosarcinales archaeon]|nr:MAG: hypothetical protein DRN97_10085 [Methanosarcinales archaeon]
MGSTDTKLDMLTNSIKELKGSIEGLKSTVEIIKETIERETMDGMISRQSPLVASGKAIEVLKKVNLLSEIDAKSDFILAEVDKESKLFIYTDLKTPEERITEIAPSIVHELIKAGKIEEKKVDLALKELEKIFGANVATYYGVLMLITAYILEKRRKEGSSISDTAPQKLVDFAMLSIPNIISSQDPVELLQKYNWDIDKAISELEKTLRVLGVVDEKKEVSLTLKLAALYEKKGQLNKALEVCKKALQIFDRIEDQRGVATAYHQLGIIAQEKPHLDEAERWYRKALEIFERLGIERGIAAIYHQLGMIAQERLHLDEAEQWYRKALEIFERLNLEIDAAYDYHQLGMIAQERQQFDVAEQWYRKALEIFERLGLERYAADEYHQLGMIAEERRQFDVAEQWYRKALEIYDKIGHPPLKVNTLAQFGVLRFRQRRYHSVAWFAKAYEIASAYNMPVAERIKSDLRRLLEVMGREDFVRAWREATGQEPRIDEIKVKGGKTEGEKLN